MKNLQYTSQIFFFITYQINFIHTVDMWANDGEIFHSLGRWGVRDIYGHLQTQKTLPKFVQKTTTKKIGFHSEVLPKIHKLWNLWKMYFLPIKKGKDKINLSRYSSLLGKSEAISETTKQAHFSNCVLVSPQQTWIQNIELIWPQNTQGK